MVEVSTLRGRIALCRQIDARGAAPRNQRLDRRRPHSNRKRLFRTPSIPVCASIR
ncbi:protein of unassigned function [Methylobacterium oryzae CBMB20]|uniref:Protein of unassigned function n=1 Tax=Methylobacterium oryzae CBMB20 TaxID=693986 RepID=A0A089P7M2_9HYPH|nr:protein of unassigned function [Methylobacterium oryzae CBMB20]